jgi:ArsR family transcriptional regulator, arsenate/arsenite/antimonite-responsive transcriptional repressor
MIDTTTVEQTNRDRRAQLLKAVADPTRLEILDLLATTETCCPCDLQPTLGIAPNLLSHHLKVLREAGLVTGTQRGRRIDYRLRPEGLRTLAAALPWLDTPALQPA